MAPQAATASLNDQQQAQVTASVEILKAAVRDHGRVTYSNSLGAESMVLTDLIWTHVPEIDIFTLDTGRLHEETYTLMDRIEGRYKRRIRIVHPQAAALEAYARDHGVNAFFNSVELRQACCRIRKIEPFKRAIDGFAAWVTGVRREQSAGRTGAQAVEFDAPNGLYKVSPILDWTHQDVWAYIRARKLPYNPLHDRGFPSIGCAPCTRAVEPGDDSRSGRWWWENNASKECGLHPRFSNVAAPAAPQG